MPKFHKLKIASLRRETDDTVSVAFEVPKKLQNDYKYIQGQYLTLKTVLGDEDTRRSYSICSGLYDNELRVAVKKIKGGLFSTFVNESLKVGDELDVMTPMGNFYTDLDPDHAHHYVGFVAGSGITPLLSIIRTIMVHEPKSRFSLIYGNRSRQTIIFREELADLKNQFMARFTIANILSREDQEVDLFKGRIDGKKAADIMDSLPGADEVFLCGPEQMITHVSETLKGRGIKAENIHFELFTSPSVQQGAKQEEEEEAKASGTSHVTVIVDGNETTFDLEMSGDSVLDAALEKGADLPFACKGGVCCTCRAKLIEGKVNMQVNYSLEKDEVDAGFILTCQSRPLTEKIVVDFDHR